MSDSKKIYFYIATNLAFLIPVPGRFAYAVIMALLFNLQMATVTLFFHAIHRLHLANMQNALLSRLIISLCIFYKQLLIIFCPVVALTLGFCIYLPMLASVIMDFFFLDYEQGGKAHLLENIKKSGIMSIFMLVFFSIRDVFGYGTFTLPGWKRLVVFHLPYNPESTSSSVFLATIPGSLVLIALLLTTYIFLRKKLRIVTNAYEALSEGGNS